MLLRVAWRNIWRNRSRSLVIVASVGIGLWAGIFLIAFYNGMIRQRIRSAIDREVSHLQVHHPRFSDDHDLRYHLGDAGAILGRLRSDPGVSVAAPRIVAHGMVSTAAGSAGVVINGVDPALEARLTLLSAKVAEGAYFTAGGRQEVIVGLRLARKLRLALHRKLVLTVSDRQGSLSSAAFRVAGIYRTPNTPYDEANLFIRLPDAAALCAMADSVNELAVLLHRDEAADSLAAVLSAAFPTAEVKAWKDLAPEMQVLVATTGSMLYVFMGVILLALGFGIVNTMLMAVLERTREIGMLLALGMSRPRVFGMVLLATFLLVMAGCPAGIAAALATVALTGRQGIDFSVFSRALESFGWETRVHPQLASGDLRRIFLLVILTALVAALLPARRAFRLRPADAMRK
jgi:ABC-type lipoprotein release transport system permease subunit